MATREDTRHYRATLNDLENIAGDPVIPGDVGSWCESVGDALKKVRTAWSPVLEMHEAAFRGILETNLEMGGQVERLKTGDSAASKTLAQIAASLTNACSSCHGGDTSEEPVGEMDSLRSDLLEWVAHARAHEKEVDHWLIEASLRDSGASD